MYMINVRPLSRLETQHGKKKAKSNSEPFENCFKVLAFLTLPMREA